MTDAERILREMLNGAGLTAKGSYNPSEVCLILGISIDTFRRMSRDYERMDGQVKAGTLATFRLRSGRDRRVTWAELVRYLEQNDSYVIDNKPLQAQMWLF